MKVFYEGFKAINKRLDEYDRRLDEYESTLNRKTSRNLLIEETRIEKIDEIFNFLSSVESSIESCEDDNYGYQWRLTKRDYVLDDLIEGSGSHGDIVVCDSISFTKESHIQEMELIESNLQFVDSSSDVEDMHIQEVVFFLIFKK